MNASHLGALDGRHGRQGGPEIMWRPRPAGARRELVIVGSGGSGISGTHSLQTHGR